MTPQILLRLTSACLLAVTACARLEVQTERKAAVTIQAAGTYACCAALVVPGPLPPDSPRRDALLEGVRSAIEQELNSRGLRSDDSQTADLLVEYHLWAWHDAKTVADVRPPPPLPAAADRSMTPPLPPVPMSLPPPRVASRVVERLRVELRLAILERATGELVYRAAGRYEYRSGQTLRDPTIREVVARLLKDW
jgi:hypothetical protein